MNILSWLFGWTRGDNRESDNRERGEPAQEAERRISPAMPMAGAGAQLSAEPDDSETEKALRRATGDKRAAR